MKTYIKYSTALKCGMHRAVVARAIEDLENVGVFRKSRVLARAKAEAVVDGINWEFIKRMIEEEDKMGKYCLIPLAESFWKTPRRKQVCKDEGKEFTEAQVEADYKMQVQEDVHNRAKNPGKFIASGHGKKTAGYGLITKDNGAISIAYLERKNKVAVGTEKACVEAMKTAAKHCQDLLDTPEAKKKLAKVVG